MLKIQEYIGWASVNTGFASAFSLHRNALFYLVQFGIIHAYVFYQQYRILQAEQKKEKIKPIFADKIILQKGNLRPIISIHDILYVRAHGDYCKVFTENESYLSSCGISEITKRFDPVFFLRVHRSYIVNQQAVRALKKEGRYHNLILINGAKVRVGETYLLRIKSLFY